MDQVLFAIDPDFSLEDIEEIGRRLNAGGALIASWISSSAGLLDIQGLLVLERLV